MSSGKANVDNTFLLLYWHFPGEFNCLAFYETFRILKWQEIHVPAYVGIILS
jgi:hypothetical protein